MGTKEDYIYAAGLFDGEGCISRHQKKRLNVDIIVKMTSKTIPYWFQKNFGGRVDINEKGNSSGWKTQYIWRLMKAKDSIKFLEDILPYIKIKKGRTRAALKLYKMIEKNQFSRIRGIKGNPGLPLKEISEREKLLEIIKKENIRGFSQEVGVV